MQLTAKQKEFWKNSTHRWNIKEGAVRSGKTYLDFFMLPRRIRNCSGNGLIVLLGNTKGTLERNILEPMRGIWGEELVGKAGNDGNVTLFGKRCHLMGADKVTSTSRLQGASVEYCYGDEITTWNEDVFAMLKSRLDKPNSTFDGTCNPAGPNHWLLKFLESDADIYRQHYTIYDNPTLPKSFVEALEREYNGSVYFDRYILGKWSLAEGLVYPMFAKEKYVFVHLPEGGRYFISVDYGTLNPCSMGLWCINGGRAYRIREFYYDGRQRQKQLTDEEYCIALENLAGDLSIESVIVDPSAASFIEAIRRRGRFNVKRAKNNVLDGIRYTAGLISKNKIAIHTSCENTLREFGEYCWDTSSADEKPLKENDHAMDDIRYFCYTILRKFM